ncbi:hypothetical protein [Desulfovibrio ferrophilus]|uniref:Uncharacterized protein n=1 Tax=Desulfovibrio ferrophilus TaxID=241368 RepID=A0A2Z6AVZ8_9BACT|nr:hypothetical protein [Desulfovibrio ferrophilus]BBD07390.1 uncharacterized protein DFE_0664 [Desulfovibrio ferrophilus]
MSEHWFDLVVCTLQQGLASVSAVDVGVLRLAEDVLDIGEYGDWNSVLNDLDNPDRMMLAELLLFPDVEISTKLESLLVDLEWTEAHTLALARTLEGEPACFQLPDATEIRFALTSDDSRMLVRRLRLTRTSPAAVQAALRCLPDKLALMARFRLRRARFPWTFKAGHFANSVIMKLGSDSDFMSLLDFCCLFLESEVDAGDLAAAMIRKRQDAERQLKTHQAFQERLDKSNFETMLLTGDRAPHVEPEVLENEMRVMDRIISTLYGTSALSGLRSCDLGFVSGIHAVQDLLHLMNDVAFSV